LIRRFDTRIAQRMLPLDDPSVARWLTDEMLRKAGGEDAWEGGHEALGQAAPEGIPAAVWQAVRAFAEHPGTELTAAIPMNAEAASARRVIARRIHVTYVPLSRVEYEFAGNVFSFVAVGRRGVERFWAPSFPPRWNRVGRFLRA